MSQSRHIEPILFIGIDEEAHIGAAANMQICPLNRNGEPILTEILYNLMKRDSAFASCVMNATEMLSKEALGNYNILTFKNPNKEKKNS